METKILQLLLTLACSFFMIIILQLGFFFIQTREVAIIASFSGYCQKLLCVQPVATSVVFFSLHCQHNNTNETFIYCYVLILKVMNHGGVLSVDNKDISLIYFRWCSSQPNQTFNNRCISIFLMYLIQSTFLIFSLQLGITDSKLLARGISFKVKPNSRNALWTILYAISFALKIICFCKIILTL